MSGRRTALVGVCSVVLATLAVVVGPAPSASALPSDCLLPLASRPQTVYVWKGLGANHDWANPLNWEHNPGADPTFLGYPQDDTNNDGLANRTATVVCISANDFVELTYHTLGGAFVFLKEIHIEGTFTVQMTQNNTGLLIDGTTNHSSFGPNTTLDLKGTFGGTATIDFFGTLNVDSAPGVPSQLTSRKLCAVLGAGPPNCPAGSLETSYTGAAGTLVIKSGADLNFTRRGVGLSYRYNLDIENGGTATVTAGPGAAADAPYLAASNGTSIDVLAGGVLEVQGNGGVYRGVTVPSQTTSALRNAGTIRKTGAGTTTVVDTAYTLLPGGIVDVQSGTLTLPQTPSGGPPLRADVAATTTFGTGTCGMPVAADGSTCPPTTGALDPTSVAVRAPALAPGGTVNLVENADTTGLLYTGISTVMQTDVDGGGATRLDPARVLLRYSNAQVGGHTAPQLHVAMASAAASSPSVIPDCAAADAIQPGIEACLDRAASATATAAAPGNVVLVVNSIVTETSRWIVRVNGVDVTVEGGIAGILKVGQTISSTYAFDPAGTTTHQWKAGGLNISGATGSTFTLTSAQLGKFMAVGLTVSSADYGSGFFQSPFTTTSVQKGDLSDGGTPQITGGPVRVGRQLTVQTPGWSPSTTVSIQWTIDGAPIIGATSATYTPRVTDRGKQLGVTATGSRTGYNSKSFDATPVVVALGQAAQVPTPAITGTARVGSRLTALVGSWLPAGIWSYTYRWYANGVLKKQTTTPSLKLTRGWKGKRVKVQVVGTATGYDPATSPLSRSTGKVKPKF